MTDDDDFDSFGNCSSAPAPARTPELLDSLEIQLEGLLGDDWLFVLATRYLARHSEKREAGKAEVRRAFEAGAAGVVGDSSDSGHLFWILNAALGGEL